MAGVVTVDAAAESWSSRPCNSWLCDKPWKAVALSLSKRSFCSCLSLSFSDVNSNQTPHGFDVLYLIERVAFMMQLSRVDFDCVLPRLAGLLAAINAMWHNRRYLWCGRRFRMVCKAAQEFSWPQGWTGCINWLFLLLEEHYPSSYADSGAQRSTTAHALIVVITYPSQVWSAYCCCRYWCSCWCCCRCHCCCWCCWCCCWYCWCLVLLQSFFSSFLKEIL